MNRQQISDAEMQKRWDATFAHGINDPRAQDSPETRLHFIALGLLALGVSPDDLPPA